MMVVVLSSGSGYRCIWECRGGVFLCRGACSWTGTVPAREECLLVKGEEESVVNHRVCATTYQWSPCGSQPTDSVGEGARVCADATDTKPRRKEARVEAFMVDGVQFGGKVTMNA